MAANTSSQSMTRVQADMRDDRVLLLTRVVAAGVIFILILAVLALYFNPARTADNFAWTIASQLTAMALGAGYAMGIYFFLRVLTTRHWHHVSGGYLPITAFTIFMALATIVNLDKFHAGAWNFILWSVVYAITPFLVPLIWWRNQKTDSGVHAPDDPVVPIMVRRVALIAGTVMVLLGVLVFVVPTIAINAFPWKLTPLTARIIGGWVMLPGIGGIVLSREARWSSWRVLIEAFTIAILLFALALPRAWNELNPSSIGTWVLLAIVAGGLVGGPVLYAYMQTRSKTLANSAQMEQA